MLHPCSRDTYRLANEVAKLREDASAMMETSRLEEASLRRLLETASAEGRRLAKILTAAEATRDEALEARRGAGGEADVLRRRLSQEIDEKQSFQRESETELAFKVMMEVNRCWIAEGQPGSCARENTQEFDKRNVLEEQL